MSDEVSDAIDDILEAELPSGEPDASGGPHERFREKSIQLLQQAAAELGHSPTLREFNGLDLGVSGDAIKNRFGSWNEAKEAAGLETRQRGTVVNIDETYFERIDAPEKAYWLGTLLACSSLRQQELGGGYSLSIVRTIDKRHFVEGVADAVDSEYSINRYEGKSNEQPRLQVAMSNPTFVDHLRAAGYPTPDEPVEDFPETVSPYREVFVRGYLESGGYFSKGGWNVTVENEQRAETLKEWFEDFGVKRVTISQTARSGDKSVVRVSNVFDVRAVFEACWPEQHETAPAHRPYVEKVLQHLDTEYPYPENVEYLDG